MTVALAKCFGPSPVAVAQTSGDSAAVVAAVKDYHRALAEADSSAALRLLALDAVILESGEIESRQEYRSHHLPADIEFTRAVKGTHTFVRVSIRGDVAWTAATSTTRGRYRGKPVSSKGVELVVLTRMDRGWRISAIHWSSGTR
jgi:ketosteroid isomerase-like protein